MRITISSVYLHIPYCKQACHYCDFHFSTKRNNSPEMLWAMQREIELRQDEFPKPLASIYFGGGTPSILSAADIAKLLEGIHRVTGFSDSVEITLEANPDDLSSKKLRELKAVGINRLSIGVQSFIEKELKMMHRAHDLNEAHQSIKIAHQYFENISIDLIYGMPESSLESWAFNLKTALDYRVPHLSAYALTIEPKTALAHFVEKELIELPDEQLVEAQYYLLLKETAQRGLVNYEFSNFGTPGYASKNNLAYWFGKNYVGIGPAAHSYDGSRRSWNVSNNPQYIKSLKADKLPSTIEILSKIDRFNEFVMTRLRTHVGIDIIELEQLFGNEFKR
ncbi:MAG: radical SAM family heme chaperone HemW [Flavobacteriaceae bacterium]|nr:radical SAM family heme chaperone HemW [Flavobacteriaceae bacterium]